MAGAIRQPIDIPALEHYISQHVPEITIPIDVKQVLPLNPSLAPIPLTSSAVWIRPIQPNLPTDLHLGPQICDAQKTTRKAHLQDCT